jgi:putative ABC transport system ATP-binding protein
MRGLNERLGLTFIFSTHDARLLEHTERIVRLCDGQIQADTQLGNHDEGVGHGQVFASRVS